MSHQSEHNITLYSTMGKKILKHILHFFCTLYTFITYNYTQTMNVRLLCNYRQLSKTGNILLLSSLL